MKGFDNVYTIIFILVCFSLIYFYIVSSREESFEIPGPAITIKKDINKNISREVSPSGPSAPNARVANIVAKQQETYNIIPNDPQDEYYGSQNIQDNLRYPERSFGPGILNNGKNIIVENEVATQENNGTFSPEFVQNGGMFNKVLPSEMNNDLTFGMA